MAAVTSGKKYTITFIHVTDPHVCNLTGYHPFFVEKRQHFGKNAEPLAHFFESIPKKYKSDFVVVTGDNLDYCNCGRAENGELSNNKNKFGLRS